MSASSATLQYPKPKFDSLNLVERFGGNFQGSTREEALYMLKQTDIRRKTLYNVLNNQSGVSQDVRYHKLVEDSAAQYVAHWLAVERIVSPSNAFCKIPPAAKGVPSISGLFYHWSGSPSLSIPERHGTDLQDTCFRFETIMAYVTWGVACSNYATAAEMDPRTANNIENLVIVRDSFMRAVNCFDLARRELRMFRFAPVAFGTLAELNDTILESLFHWTLYGTNNACMLIANALFLQNKMDQSMYERPSLWLKFVMREHWGCAAYATDALEASQQMGGLVPKNELGLIAACTRQHHMSLFLQYKARLILQENYENQAAQSLVDANKSVSIELAYAFLNLSEAFVQYARDNLLKSGSDKMRHSVSEAMDNTMRDNQALKQILQDANQNSLAPVLLPSLQKSFNELPTLIKTLQADERPQFLFKDDLNESLDKFVREIGLVGESDSLSESTSVGTNAQITALPAISRVPQLKAMSERSVAAKASGAPSTATAIAQQLVPPVLLTNVVPTRSHAPNLLVQPNPAKNSAKVDPVKPRTDNKVQTQPAPTAVVQDEDDYEWPEDEDPDTILASYLPTVPIAKVAEQGDSQQTSNKKLANASGVALSAQ